MRRSVVQHIHHMVARLAAAACATIKSGFERPNKAPGNSLRARSRLSPLQVTNHEVASGQRPAGEAVLDSDHLCDQKAGFSVSGGSRSGGSQTLPSLFTMSKQLNCDGTAFGFRVGWLKAVQLPSISRDNQSLLMTC